MFIFLFLPLINKAQDLSGDSLVIHKMAANILSSDAAYNNLYDLTKNIGARLSGSVQMYLAEEWGAKALKDAGAENVILQECMVPHWVRGGQDKAYIIYEDEKGVQQKYDLNVLALGNSVGTGTRGIELPLIRVSDFNELEAKKDQLKDKIVFYNVPFEDTLINTFFAYGKNVVYRGFGASRAAKYGAAAVLIRSMTNTPGNVPHTGSLRYTSEGEIPAAAVGLEDVKKLNVIFEKNIAVTATLFTHGQMLPDTIAHNVIGELKGSKYPEQVITVGGHLDSWDVAEGAHDDGAGIVQTIEVLRAFKALGYQPGHTIRFVLFANEENGTRGAKKYAEEARQNNEQHIFALESDAGGFTPRGFSFDVDDAAIWTKINSWKPLFTPYYGDRFEKGEAGADIGYLKEMFNTPQAGLTPDSQRYFSVHHAATDVFENVDIRELKLGAINMAALIYLVDKYGLD